MRYHYAQSGFSLIEVLVSVTILAVGLLALAGFNGNLYRNVAHSSDATRAMTQLQQFIDNARTKGAAALIDGADTTPSDCSTSNIHRYWTVADVANANGVKHMAVSACWTDSSGQLQTVAISTYIGTGSTGITLGAPPVKPALTTCTGILYKNKSPTYAAGTVVYHNGYQYTCVPSSNAYYQFCGTAGFEPGTNGGGLAWIKGDECTPP